MAGIYLHIPFCKQACHYCNFHFSTSRARQSDMVDMLCREMSLRTNYLPTNTLKTIYLGGGTPSILTPDELNQLFSAIASHFQVASDAEVTLEANPDDLTPEKIRAIRDTPVNRFSIGIQSFFEEDLRFMNRAHHAREAFECIERAQAAGFTDLTIDLIYGSPTTSTERWIQNLEYAFGMGIPHLSCYCLTVEPKTALDHFVRQGKVEPVDEHRASEQFELLLERSAEAGYEQYEISNFARDQKYARHNTAYWLGEPYLGIGPAAHSFDGKSRQWNVANNARYIQAMEQAKDDYPEDLFEREELSPDMRYNEYVMTGLRTKWGIDAGRLAPVYQMHLEKEMARHIKAGYIVAEEKVYQLTQAGKLLADRIAADVFYT